MSEPTNQKEIMALIKRISGQANFIGTPRIYVDIFKGDIVEAVWFNQVVYWDSKNSEPIGFYKTYAEWYRELGLSEYQVRRVAKDCELRGLVNITFRKVYGTPKNHYLVIWTNLLKVLKTTLEKPDPEETKGSETKGTEPEDSAPSMESEGTKDSLTENEITTNSNKDSLIEKIESYASSVFDTPHKWHLAMKRRLQDDSILIAADGPKIIVSGLSAKKGQFTEAQIWTAKYCKSFENTGLQLEFRE